MKGDKIVTTMKRICVLAVTILAAAASSHAGERLNIYILAGQSNMQGQARLRTMPRMAMDPKTKPLHDKIIDQDGTPRVYDDVRVAAITGGRKVVRKNGPLTVGFGGALNQEDKFGPELPFGITMYEHLKEPMLIIKTAWGGKTLCVDFRPPSAGPYYPDPSKVKDKKTHKGVVPAETVIANMEKAQHRYYRLMVEHVNTVLADPSKYHPAYDKDAGYEIAGFVWFQGWNDMCNGRAYPNRAEPGGYDLYTELLAHFIRDVRKEFEAPKMPFVIGVIGVDGDKANDYITNLRPAMAAPASMPEFKGNVAAVHTAQFWDEEIGELEARGTLRNRARYNAKNRAKWPEIDRKLAPLFAELQEAKKNRAKNRPQIRKLKQQIYEVMYTPEERHLMEIGRSNGSYHYLGSAKIYSRIGEAFAKAMIDLDKEK